MDEPLAPLVNSLSAPYWKAAAEGRLVLPWCVSSDLPFWPPSPTSPFVTAGQVAWRPADPGGVLRSRVIYRRAFQQALAANVPYGIGLVELDCGVRLQAHIATPDDDGAARAGDRVTIHFVPLAPGCLPVPHARRAGSD